MKLITLALGLTLIGGAWLLPASAQAQEDDLEAVAAIVDVLFAGDEEAIRPLIGYSQYPCDPEPMGIGANPMCLEGEEEGTLVNAFSSGACEGGLTREEDIDGIVEVLAAPGPQFVAVYDVRQQDSFGEYVAMYTHTRQGNPGAAGRVDISGGKIVNYGSGCAANAEELAAQLGGIEVELPSGTTGLPSTGAGTLESDHTPLIAAWLAVFGVVVLSGGALAAVRRR
jgi:hypothetical protein